MNRLGMEFLEMMKESLGISNRFKKMEKSRAFALKTLVLRNF